MSIETTQDEIYHWTINGLLKKVEARDDLIFELRKEIAQLKRHIATRKGGIEDGETND